MRENEELVTEKTYSFPFLTLISLIIKLGSLLPERLMHKLDSLLNFLSVGRWLRKRAFEPIQWASGRPDLFRKLARMKNLTSRQVLYLEFGVYKGLSIRFWADLLKNPLSELVGFDTFEGLPESWKVYIPEGTFSTGGVLPNVTDTRVEFVRGRFRDSLKNFTVPKHEALVINIDSDLYSSAWEVFSALENEIKPGTIIYFDEFCDRDNELRAFEEYLSRTQAKFQLLVADRTCMHMAFEKIT